MRNKVMRPSRAALKGQVRKSVRTDRTGPDQTTRKLPRRHRERTRARAIGSPARRRRRPKVPISLPLYEYVLFLTDLSQSTAPVKYAVHVVPFKAPPFLSLPFPSLQVSPRRSLLSLPLSPLRFCVVCLRLVTFVLDSELNEDIIRLKNQRERGRGRCGSGGIAPGRKEKRKKD